MNKTAFHRRAATYLLLVIILAAFMLAVRNAGLYPIVFADEYTYSKFSRLVPLSEANIPGYLYFVIYRATTFCGDGFLACARLFNIAFFVAASPFVFLIAKRITNEKRALFISALSLFAPLNTYTAYFMPESLYYLAFWVFTYFSLKLKSGNRTTGWLLIGVIFGISALVKPHALFLTPGILIYFLVVQRQFMSETASSFEYAKYFGLFVAAAATKLVISFSLAGQSGVTIFGPAYISVAAQSMNIAQYTELAQLSFENLAGHILSLALLFSVPAAQLVLFFFQRRSKPVLEVNIALYAFLVLACLLIVVAVFTASVSGAGPYENNTRLHMRYYNFAFPLLLLVAASELPANSSIGQIKARLLIGLPIGSLLCYAAYSGLSGYTPNFVDNPELRGLTFNPLIFYGLSGISILSLGLWVYAPRLGAKLFLFIFMPLVVAYSTIYLTRDLSHRLVPDVFDKAGIFTRNYLSNDDLSSVVVVGSNPVGLYRSLFFLDNAKAVFEVIPDDSAYDLSTLPRDKKWVLVIGDHELVSETAYSVPMNGFTLARLSARSP